MSILRRFKGKLYSSLYSCEEFNIANRLARKIKHRLSFISQLFVSALKTRYTVYNYILCKYAIKSKQTRIKIKNLKSE